MAAKIPPILAPSEKVDAAFWLNAAHGSVRRFCGWHVAPNLEETITLDGPGGHDLLVPSLRVTALVAAESDGVDVTDDVDISKSGLLRRRNGCWTDRLGRVTVTIRHGYDLDEVPELAALIASVAKRGPSSGGVVDSQSVNGASVKYATAGGAPISIPLLITEKQQLEPYRIEWGTR